MKNVILFLIILTFATAKIYAQDAQAAKDETDNAVVKATNFTVPNSLAFNLLDVSPNQVHRPGFAKDFKFDWLIKDNRLASNIAIELQPAWVFFYKETDYKDLVKNNAFQRALSSLTVSVGTAKKETNTAIAFGAKINLYAEKNPIYDIAYINKIGNFFPCLPLNIEIETLIFAKEGITDPAQLDSLNAIIKSKQLELDSCEKHHFEEIDSYKEAYEKENWNATLVDLGYGRIYSYFSDSFDSLSFSSNGYGAWISGNYGIGKKILLNGMVKTTEISNDNLTTIGANIRYGSLKVNAFVEGVYTFSSENNHRAIAYGGDINFRDFITLQFGLRTEYDDDFNLKRLVPAVNFNYILD